MVTPSSVLRGLAALALFASASALRPPTRLRPTMSAAVLPTAYRALAAGCAWRATSSDPASAAVLLSVQTQTDRRGQNLGLVTWRG